MRMAGQRPGTYCMMDELFVRGIWIWRISMEERDVRVWWYAVVMFFVRVVERGCWSWRMEV